VRAVIKYLYLKGMTQQAMFSDMEETLGEPGTLNLNEGDCRVMTCSQGA